jgi:putative heme-binding domain-containing protein
LQSVAVSLKGLTVQKLARLAKSPKVIIRREAIRSLALHEDEKRAPALASLAADQSLPPVLRADAIAGLAPIAEEHVWLLKKLTSSKNAIVSAEAARTLASAGMVDRELPPKPELDDVPAWLKLVEEAPGEPDTSLGRRLFFHSSLGTCHRCHSFDGRGIEVGPDLTTLHKQDGIDRTWLLTHILDPNAEVAPYFRPQQITTKDGGSYLGFILGKEGKAQSCVGTDGKKFSVLKADVVKREEFPISLMPPRLDPQHVRQRDSGFAGIHSERR